jgi:tetratricopeptide (TPR) repeat protein
LRFFLFFRRLSAAWSLGLGLFLTLGSSYGVRAQEAASEAAPAATAPGETAPAETARAQAAPVQTVGDSRAKIEAAWSSIRAPLLAGQSAPEVEKGLADIRRLQWVAGIRSLPLLSAALIRAGADLSRKGQSQPANNLIQWSRRLSPGRADLDLARARYWLMAANFSAAQAGQELLQFLRAGREDFDWSLRILARLLWSGLWAGWLILWVLAATMAARYLRVYLHDFVHLFPEGFLPAWMLLTLGVILPLLPLLFAAPLWLVACAGLLTLSLYFQARERIVVILVLLSLAALPTLHRVYAQALAAPSDPVLAAIVHAREGDDSDEDLKLLESQASGNAGSLEVLMALAKAHQDQGRFTEAGQDYQRLLELPQAKNSPYQEAIYNNLGNLWVAAGDNRQALAYYQEAAKISPLPAEVAYNLGQLYHAFLDIEKGDEWSKQAAAIASDEVDGWGEMTDSVPAAQRMVEMPIPLSLLWARALQDTPRSEAVRRSTWQDWAGVIPPMPVSLIFLSSALLVGLTFLGAGRVRISKPCSSCGQPVCPHCHRLSKDPSLCSPCYHVFKAQGGLDPRVRLARKAAARRFQEIWRTASMIATVLVPGSGHLLQGAPIAGLVFLLLAGCWLAPVLAPAGAWRPEVPILSDGLPWGTVAAGVGYLIVLGLAAGSTAARMRK